MFTGAAEIISIHSIPSHLISLRSILILSTHFRLDTQLVTFSPGFATVYLSTSYACFMPHPSDPTHTSAAVCFVSVSNFLTLALVRNTSVLEEILSLNLHHLAVRFYRFCLLSQFSSLHLTPLFVGVVTTKMDTKRCGRWG